MLPLLVAFFSLAPDNPIIDKALAQAEQQKYDEAEKLVRPLLQDPREAPLAAWALDQIELIRTRSQPPTISKIDRFSELIRKFETLQGVPDRVQESTAQALEAQARTFLALGNSVDAVAALQRSEANYAALMKKEMPDSASIRIRQGFMYVATLICATRPPPLTALRDRTRELEKIADHAMMFQRSYPQAFECALYASDLNRLLAQKGEVEELLAQTEDVRRELRELVQTSWTQARIWAEQARRALISANGHAADIRLRAAQREIDAYLGLANWLGLHSEPFKAVIQQAMGLVDEALKISGQAPAFQLRLARVLILDEKWPRAIEILAEIPRWTEDVILRRQARSLLMGLKPTQPEHLLLIAHELQADADFPEAIEHYKAAQKAGPSADLKAECWLGLGECYLQTDRIPEAVEAYSFFQTPEFEASPHAQKAGLTLLRILMAQKPQDKDHIDSLKKFLDGRGWLGPFDQRNTACQLEQEKKYREAADRWKKLIDAEPASLRQEALSRTGFCLLKAAEGLMGDDRAALEKKAIEYFDRHLEEARRQAGDPRDMVVSIYYLARLKSASDPKGAAKSVERFIKENPNLDVEIRVRLSLRALDAYVKAADLRAAQETLEYIEGIHADRQEDYARALGLLGWGYRDQAEKTQDEKLADAYFNRAIQLYSQSLTTVPKPVLPFEEVLAVAGRTFERAKVKAGTDVSLFARARTLFEQIRTHYPEALKKTPQDVEVTLGTLVDWTIGICFLRENNFDSALENFERVDKKYSHEQLDITEAKADCWFGKALQAEGKQRIEFLQMSRMGYTRIIDQYHKAHTREEAYFRNLYKYFEALMLLDPREVTNLIESFRLRGIGKDWDSNRWGYKTRIRDLEKRLSEKDPKFRQLPE